MGFVSNVCLAKVNFPLSLALQRLKRRGYLVGYTEENSYLIWIPEKRKTITAISVVFDERIPDHKESYWAALAQYHKTTSQQVM